MCSQALMNVSHSNSPFPFLLLCLRAKESVNLCVCLIPPTNHVLLAVEEKQMNLDTKAPNTHGVSRGFKEKFVLVH